MEGDDGTGVTALPDHLDWPERLALGVVLPENLALAVNFRDKAVRQGVDAGHAHAVQTAGHLIAGLVELAAGVEDGQYDFKRGAVLLLVHPGRDTSAIVGDPYGIAGKHLDINAVAITGHRLIDTVVHHLIDQVVKSPLGNVADVHRRTLADRFQPFKHLYTVGGVLLLRLLHIFSVYHLSIVK